MPEDSNEKDKNKFFVTAEDIVKKLRSLISSYNGIVYHIFNIKSKKRNTIIYGNIFGYMSLGSAKFRLIHVKR